MTQKQQEIYLTEMKELPPSYPSDEGKNNKAEEPSKKEAVDHDIPKETSLPEVENKKEVDIPQKKIDIPSLEESEIKTRKLPLTYKDIILAVVNFVSVAFLVIVLVNFPEKSAELRELRTDEIRRNSIVGVEISEIEMARPKAEAISKFFLDEGGVVDFVNDIELQKTEGGAISKVTFASQNAVADRMGNYGIPIVIELVGNWQAIDADLQKIDVLPYLFRPVKVEIGYAEDDPRMVIYKYGVFLYVGESLGKTR